MTRYHILGGNQGRNGDYENTHLLARRGDGTSRVRHWRSGKKHSYQVGDQVLIYMLFHGVISVGATVIAPAWWSEDDQCWRVPLGNWRILTKQPDLKSLRRLMPKWGWLRNPQGKPTVPAEYLATLKAECGLS
jgi:hypothetical protein